MVCLSTAASISSSATPAHLITESDVEEPHDDIDDDCVRHMACKAAVLSFAEEFTDDAPTAQNACTHPLGASTRCIQRVAREFLWGRNNARLHSRLRGTFKIIAFGSNDRFVALETSWQADQEQLTHLLEAYASMGRFGVEGVDPEEIYACRGHESWSMQRCRKVVEASAGHLFMELIDEGREQMVNIERLLVLSALLKTWSIKAVDLEFQGFDIALQSPNFPEKIKAHVLDKKFDLHYLCERRGALARDKLTVLDMSVNEESVLADLVRKEILVRS